MQLIDARRDEHLWADDYELDLSAENLFEVESEVARRTAFEIGVSLTPEESDQIARLLTEDTDAYLFFLKGKEAFLDERQRGWMASDFESIQFFERAIALDSSFALAHANLALSLTYTIPDQERTGRARSEAEHALSLSPGLPEARIALGRCFSRAGRSEEALVQFEAAELENPNQALAAFELGSLQHYLGKSEIGRRALLRAKDLGPKNPILNRELSRSFMFAHQYGDALQAAAEREASYPSGAALRDRAYIYVVKGDLEAAQATALEAVALFPGELYQVFPGYLWTSVWGILPAEQRRVAFEVYAGDRDLPCSANIDLCVRRAVHENEVGSKQKAALLFDSLRAEYEQGTVSTFFNRVVTYQGLGEKEEAIQEAEDVVSYYLDVERGGELDRYLFGPGARILLAQVLAHFGEHDRAIDILEQDLPAPSWLSVPLLEIDPVWNPLRTHPRFQALVDRERDRVF